MPKMLYMARIAYRTPAGRKVWFDQRAVAADSLAECEAILRDRLESEVKYGRRLVDTVIGEFSAVPIGPQINTR